VPAQGRTRRTFIAVPLPPDLQATLFEVRSALARRLPAISWLRKMENLHITIQFLGAVSDPQLAGLQDALARSVEALPSFDASVGGLGAFPAPERAQVIWAGVDDLEGGLARVAAAIRPVTEGIGDAKDLGSQPPSKPFRAHVTLGRSKTGVDLGPLVQAAAGQHFGRITVDEVHLYESRPGPEGSTYILRSRARLASLFLR